MFVIQIYGLFGGSKGKLLYEGQTSVLKDTSENAKVSFVCTPSKGISTLLRLPNTRSAAEMFVKSAALSGLAGEATIVMVLKYG